MPPKKPNAAIKKFLADKRASDEAYAPLSDCVLVSFGIDPYANDEYRLHRFVDRIRIALNEGDLPDLAKLGKSQGRSWTFQPQDIDSWLSTPAAEFYRRPKMAARRHDQFQEQDSAG